jgi:hypothetical protein
MADNVTTAAGTFASDDISSVQYQRNKIALGLNNVYDGDVSETTPLPTKLGGAATATLSNVASSATSVTVLAANTARRGAIIHNDSTQILYLKFGSTASTTSFTRKMVSDSSYEIPFGYTGILTGIWASANGFARVTEITV